LPPTHTGEFEDAYATGKGFTVMPKTVVLVQPMDETVTVYVPELFKPELGMETEADDDWKLSGPFHDKEPEALVTFSWMVSPSQ